MDSTQPRVIRIESGVVRPSGSWIYVWIDVDEGSVACVGATGFDPELRAHIHLTSEDPDLGRVRATVPRYNERTFDVLAFGLPSDIDRSAAKAALLTELNARDLLESDARSVDIAAFISRIADAIEQRVRET
ncbi:hypothetical protein [Microbacterium sp.]|uniref:hypothetical protein n=1 Tax=Microbacterium sp. TaxID=51671 RepID=UPI003C2748E4